MGTNGEARDFEDSREELERELREACWGNNVDRLYGMLSYCKKHGLTVSESNVLANHEGHAVMTVVEHMLNRQAAIVERYWRGQVDALAAKGDKLAEANAELQAKLDALEAHGVTVSEPFCGGYEVYNQFACDWRRKADMLEAERDYWRGQVERCVAAAVKPERHAEGVMAYPRDELRFAEPALLVVDAIDSLRDFHADDRIANKRLDAECDALARDLAESEKLRDELREKLSAAIGHAVDILALQDLEGEVVA